MGPFLFLDARNVIDESIIGIVCGMALQQSRKPVLGFSLGDNDTLKVSGRSPKALVEKGINLGALMKDATEKLGGAGGGHRVAAGASIPADSFNAFLLFAGEFMKSANIG
jgi:RecJ-like exonuclease